MTRRLRSRGVRHVVASATRRIAAPAHSVGGFVFIALLVIAAAWIAALTMRW